MARERNQPSVQKERKIANTFVLQAPIVKLNLESSHSPPLTVEIKYIVSITHPTIGLCQLLILKNIKSDQINSMTDFLKIIFILGIIKLLNLLICHSREGGNPS